MRNDTNSDGLNKSLKKIKEIKDEIKDENLGIKRLELLQENFGYIVTALLRLRKYERSDKKSSSTKRSVSFKYVDSQIFGGWLGPHSLFNIKENTPLNKLSSKKCLATGIISFSINDLLLEEGRPTEEDLSRYEELCEGLNARFSRCSAVLKEYFDDIKTEEKSQKKTELCGLIYEIFCYCRSGLQSYIEAIKDWDHCKSKIDNLAGKGSVGGVKDYFDGLFNTGDAGEKEDFLQKLVEINKEKSLPELIPKAKVEKHIPVAFIFNNKNSILEWAFYCLYSNPTLKVDDVPKFIDACVKEEKLLPDGWIFSHKLKFLKLNGKPIPGATTSGTKILNLISLLKKKFNGFSYLIVNFNERIISYSANKDHKFGEAGLRFLKIKNPDVKDMCDLCNKVELVFNGDMNIETDILEEDKGDPSCCYKEFFSTKDAKEKRNYLVKLVEINKEKSLSELIPKAEVEEHIPLVFFFDNKNSVMEWGFYCLYSNPSLRPENIEKFLRDCLQKKEFLPPGWILLHELEFLKVNGGPIPGATNSDAKILAVVSKVREKFGTLSYAEISFRKEIELKINGKSIKKLFDANRNYKFGSTKLQLLKIKNPSIKTLPDSCNKVDLIFEGGAPMKMEVPEVTEEISEIKKSKLKLADKIKSKFKKGKKETSE